MVHMADPGILGRFPFAVSDYYGSAKFAVFMLEGLTALIICVVLLCRKDRFPGGKAMLMVTLYASTQVLFESMRQDAVLRFGFVRINQLVGAVIVAVIAVCCIRRSGKGAWAWIRSLILLLGAVALVMLMEFAIEHKISALEWMSLDMCYIVSAIGCELLCMSAALPMRDISNAKA